MDAQKNKELLHTREADGSKWTIHSNHNIKCFTEDELKRITDNYKTILGRGGFGVVFKGVLEDNNMVAVKRFIHNVKENFDKELLVHREINHKNVVRLIGYCVEENALMMITEFIPNGNLATILHHDKTPIPLDIRLRIATQCAEALAYMHSDMYTQVIHGDIKPDNILLDDNLNAKISDFGISRLVNTDNTLYTGNVIGSIGYMDPLFAQDGRLTAKSDVYSFGVVLLELLTRTNATKKVTTDREASLVTIFSEAHERGRIKDVRKFLDSELHPWRNKNILDEVGKLAAECLVLNREKRLEMKRVVERLGKAMEASLEGKQSVDFFYWARKTKPAQPVNFPATARVSAQPVNFPATARVSAQPVNFPATARVSPRCRRFSYEEIVAATSLFDKSHLLGHQYGFGRYYRGVIDHGEMTVAVERCWHRYSYDDKHSFLSFVESMSKLRHNNVVPLIGYCDDKSNGMMYLVYNYMDQGSLDDHLFGALDPLTWKQRLEICIGAARGLDYLHRAAFIHRDLNPKNILLDKELVATISGIKMTDPWKTGNFINCTALDPEFYSTLKLTEKSDVYSFGAVLLEVLCAQRHFEFKNKPGDLSILEVRALSCMTDFSLIDFYLNGTIIPKCYKKFLDTALKCVSEKGIDRPSMGDVVSDLEAALQLQLQAERAAQWRAEAVS